MKNIILIGLSGCGKSSLAKKLSKHFNVDCFDTDSFIEKKENKKITEIFNDNGEKHFRDLETEVAKHIETLENTIVATGGGFILRKENMEPLRQNSIIVFINRDPNDIIENVDTKDRPLLKDNREKTWELYNERIHLYKSYADIEIKTRNDFKKTLYEIIEKVKKYGY